MGETDESQSAVVRFGFLYSFVELEGVHSSSSDRCLTYVEIKSDIVNPGSTVTTVGIRHEYDATYPSLFQSEEKYKSSLKVYHSISTEDVALDQIILSRNFKISNGDLQGTIELLSSSDQPKSKEKPLTFEFSIRQDDELVQHLKASLRHPNSSTDVNLLANFTCTPEVINLDARIEDGFQSSRFLNLITNIKITERTLDFQVRTANHSIVVSSSVTQPTDSTYQLKCDTVLNDVDVLSLTSQYNLHRPELMIDSISDGVEFNMYAGMPSNREVMVRSTRTILGRTITDGHLNLKLNTTSLLSSRLYWRADSIVELQNHGFGVIVDVLATIHSIADVVVDILFDCFAVETISNAPVFNKVRDSSSFKYISV